MEVLLIPHSKALDRRLRAAGQRPGVLVFAKPSDTVGDLLRVLQKRTHRAPTLLAASAARGAPYWACDLCLRWTSHEAGLSLADVYEQIGLSTHGSRARLYYRLGPESRGSTRSASSQHDETTAAVEGTRL